MSRSTSPFRQGLLKSFDSYWKTSGTTLRWAVPVILLPYLLMLAASSFIYVALADLIPQLQQRLNARDTAAQILWLAIGMGLVGAVGMVGGEHSHDVPAAHFESRH